MDDPAIEQHKAIQRRKAETNSQRETQRQQKLDADRKEKNEAFLQRLEGRR